MGITEVFQLSIYLLNSMTLYKMHVLLSGVMLMKPKWVHKRAGVASNRSLRNGHKLVIISLKEANCMLCSLIFFQKAHHKVPGPKKIYC